MSNPQAHCPACHRQFGGQSGFTAHQVVVCDACHSGAPCRLGYHTGGNARIVCRDPAELGQVLDAGGVWRRPMTHKPFLREGPLPS